MRANLKLFFILFSVFLSLTFLAESTFAQCYDPRDSGCTSYSELPKSKSKSNKGRSGQSGRSNQQRPSSQREATLEADGMFTPEELAERNSTSAPTSQVYGSSTPEGGQRCFRGSTDPICNGGDPFADPNRASQTPSTQSGSKSGNSNAAATDNSDASSSSGSSSTTISQQEIVSKMNECESSKITAQSACDAESNQGLSQSKSSISNFVVQAGQMTSAGAACTKLADLSAAANAALAGYRVNCEVSQSSCVDACSSAANLGTSMPDVVSRARDNKRICEKMITNVNQAGQALQNTLATTISAQQCKNQLSGSYCAQDPNAPGCEPVDCTGPMADTNPICICQRDPNNPVCNGVAGGPQVGNGGLTGGANNGEIAGGNKKTNGLEQEANSIVSGLADREELEHGIPKKVGPGEDPGGKKGGGANLGSDSAGGGGGKRNNGGYYTDSAKSPLNGFYGSSGGSSGGGRSPSSSGGYSKSNGPNQPNLRDFLPGGAMAMRIKNNYLGSIGKDGVTGPHSSLWTKIKFRYRVNQGTLLPY